MSEKRFTRQKPNLPYDDYTVIARLTPFMDRPYGLLEATAISDALHLQPKDIEIQDDRLFVRLRLGRLAGEAVWKEAAYSLHCGLAHLAIDPDISAGADATREIIEAPSLAGVFPRMLLDITPDLADELLALADQPVQEVNLDLELQQLLS